MRTMLQILADEAIWGVPGILESIGHVSTFRGRELTSADLDGVDALVVRSITPVGRDLLEGSAVRFVGTASSGTDHVDEAWLAGRGVAFASSAGCNTVTVAQHLVAVLHLLSRRAGLRLKGKTLGIVGAGRIGSLVARCGELLGLRVLACDPPRQRHGRGTGLFPPEAVRAEADLISLHVPLVRGGRDPTERLVDGEWISACKHGVFLINTSRGEVIDESALAAALDDGRVAGAALDVWRGEPRINADLVTRCALATPHIAGYSRAARRRAAERMAEALAVFAGVEPPVWAAPERPPKEIAWPRGAPWWGGLGETLVELQEIESIDAQLREAVGGTEPATGFDRLRASCADRAEVGDFRLYGEGVAGLSGALPDLLGCRFPP
jgi:erythronate-4-phosphate dehydrogenase